MCVRQGNMRSGYVARAGPYDRPCKWVYLALYFVENQCISEIDFGDLNRYSYRRAGEGHWMRTRICTDVHGIIMSDHQMRSFGQPNMRGSGGESNRIVYIYRWNFKNLDIAN